MKTKISDLLDYMDDDSVELSSPVAISTVNIKQLTMEKVSAQRSGTGKSGASSTRARKPVMRKVLLAAVIVVAAISCTAVAALALGSSSPFYQVVFGTFARGSQEARVEYSDDDNHTEMVLNLPNSERVPVDERVAEEQIGASIISPVGTYELKSYTGKITTLTIEDFLYDAGTGAFYIYYSVERESGGFPEYGIFDRADGFYWNGTGLVHLGYFEPGREYIDRANSTESKLYISAAGINNYPERDMRDMYMQFGEYVDGNLVADSDKTSHNTDLGMVLFEFDKIYLPQVTNTLPNFSFADGDATVGVFSAVGITLALAALGSDPVDDTQLKYVALEYGDGTRYVILDRDNNIDNTDYALIASDGNVTYCFNRIVDTGNVTGLIVNGAEYAVK
jgi:hypothetical protein